MKRIKSALVSVFYKDGLENIIKELDRHGITIYSTGGTQAFIEKLGVSCVPVESLTAYPSILGGRVKTLHPLVFGGILGRRDNETDTREMGEYKIPEIDLVIVDLYPFEETVKSTNKESLIIEKIDVGGPSMLRAAAKNHRDVTVIAAKKDYPLLEKILVEQEGQTSIEQRRELAIKAFDVCTGYDIAISNYFAGTSFSNPFSAEQQVLRYGENPHQNGKFIGDYESLFTKLNGKELSYNNLVDVDAAIQLMQDISTQVVPGGSLQGNAFAIIKHTNVCGAALANSVHEAWKTALAGDPESAFGGVLISNSTIDKETAEAINEIFFEVLVAPNFNDDALEILKSKKNRIILQNGAPLLLQQQTKSLLNGTLVQDADNGNYLEWKELGGRTCNENERADLSFANILVKHLKSNAIAIVKNRQLIGKGCGQTSRIDALRHAIEKSRTFGFDLDNAVLASDAFFPFDDCVKLANEAGIEAFIQPGGSIRDNDSIKFCVENNLVMVITGMRHFKH